MSKSVAKVLSKVTKVLWLVAKAYGLLLWCYGQMLKYDTHAHRPAQFNEISTPGATLRDLILLQFRKLKVLKKA